jgi:hypothetical protein
MFGLVSASQTILLSGHFILFLLVSVSHDVPFHLSQKCDEK